MSFITFHFRWTSQYSSPCVKSLIKRGCKDKNGIICVAHARHEQRCGDTSLSRASGRQVQVNGPGTARAAPGFRTWSCVAI